MTSEIDEFRTSLVAAVQAELERHASAVVAEVDRLRADGQRERAEMRDEFARQVAVLAQTVEQVQAHSESDAERARQSIEQLQAHSESSADRARQSVEQSIEQVRADSESSAERARQAVEQSIEQRLAESEARQTRRLDDVAGSLDGLVQEATRPLVVELGDRQDALMVRVDGFDTSLRKFDEQAARMVTYFNEVSQHLEVRQTELNEVLKADVAAQVEGLTHTVEENDSSVRRFQTDLGQSVAKKINDAEDRFNNRLLAAETRLKEESGLKIAEIDAHVGKVGRGLDDTMTVLNTRVAALDDRFVEVGRRIAEVESAVGSIDEAVIEELKEKMSTAVGEAMLVRIEMERLEKAVNEKTDTLVVRMTDVEIQLQDATMDVSTAVQLDRLEEIERALIEIDPNKFVLKAEPIGADASSGAEPPNGTYGS